MACKLEDYAIIGDCETARVSWPQRVDRLAVLAALRQRRLFRGSFSGAGRTNSVGG
jgi:hypothetical protein